MITINDLHKRFGHNEVLKGVNLNIEQPGIYAVLGPNGSGKTTLLKSILGMTIPTTGAITFEGASIKGHWRYRNHISYLPQIANFPPNLKVQELIDMIQDLRPDQGEDIDPLIECFQLRPFLKKKLGHLSGGTKQKVNILLTFMYPSPLFILDEPTTGLDPVSLIELKELIRAQRDLGKTILISSHIMSFVEEVADQLVFLLEGRVYFQGDLDQLRQQTAEENFEHAIANLLKSNNG